MLTVACVGVWGWRRGRQRLAAMEERWRGCWSMWPARRGPPEEEEGDGRGMKRTGDMDCIHMQETIPTQDAVQTQRPSPEKKTIHVQMTIPINTTKRSGVLKSMVNKCYLKKVCVLVDGSLDAHEQQ